MKILASILFSSVPLDSVDLNHTPGIYYTIAYWLSAMLFLFLIAKKKDRRFYCLSLGFFVVLFTIMQFTDGSFGLIFVLSEFLNFFILFFFMKLISRSSWRKALYFSLRAFVVGEFSASLEWQLFYYGLTKWSIPLNNFTSTLFMFIIHGTVLTILFLLENPYRHYHDSIEFSNRELQIAVYLCLFVFVLSNMSFVFPHSPFSSTTVNDIFIIRTLSDFGGMGLMFAHHVQLCEVNNRVEREFLEKLLYMQEENYRMSEESIDLINKKYHDLKHYIHLLRSDVTKDQKLDSLEEMEQDIRFFETQSHTGNKVLDTLLAAKGLQCQEENISITCVADGDALSFMEPADISVLFGNILDNAIEGVSKIKDTSKRLIHVTVACQKNFLRIRVENCCMEHIHFANGLPLTTKRDHRFHGYGMKSIQSITHKYGGSLVTQNENGWFEVRLLIPIPSQTKA